MWGLSRSPGQSTTGGRRTIPTARGAPFEEPSNGNPCLACFLFLVSIFILLNLDALLNPTSGGPENEPRPSSEAALGSSNDNPSRSFFDLFSEQARLQQQKLAPLPYPPTSFNLKGKYTLQNSTHALRRSSLDNKAIEHNLHNLLENSGFSDDSYLDGGEVHIYFVSRPFAIRSVRLVSLELKLFSRGGGVRRLELSGPEFQDLSSITFQGSVSPNLIHPSLRSESIPTSQGLRHRSQENGASMSPGNEVTTQCILLGVVHFNKIPPLSKSARQVQSYQSEWGIDQQQFDDSDWLNTRRLSDPSLDSSSKEPSSSSFKEGLIEKGLESEVFIDMDGVIFSPNCSFRISLSASEIDLQSLANVVIRLASFFVLKGILEIRFLLSQIRYTESGGSSASKVCVLSLGIHSCVDCFESIVLISEAITSKFMTSTFIIMIIFKLMFITVLELRYLIVVLKARFITNANNSGTTTGTTNETDDLGRLVKLHTVGTALTLIWILKLLPIFAGVIVVLYLFWIPQIVFDVWKGNRKSLSLTYVLGMSVCRLLFPLYLWGCPASVFSEANTIFKPAPDAPNLTLCVILVAVVVGQVIWVLIQHFFGPRFLVPLSWLPNVYNYYRSIPKPGQESFYECVICMTDVSYTQRTLVVTPCDHHFHESCLQQWIDVKAECPTCRRPLPPFC